MRGKEGKKRPFAGIMLMLLYFSKKAKALIVIGGVSW